MYLFQPLPRCRWYLLSLHCLKFAIGNENKNCNRVPRFWYTAVTMIHWSTKFDGNDKSTVNRNAFK